MAALAVCIINSVPHELMKTYQSSSQILEGKFNLWRCFKCLPYLLFFLNVKIIIEAYTKLVCG